MVDRNKIILKKDNTALLLIDIQEKILGLMANKDLVLRNSLQLIIGFKILNIPIF